MSPDPVCRSCGAPLRHTLVDLGMSPLCESYVDADGLNRAEAFYPLRGYVCSSCLLAQLEEFGSPEAIFTEYAYFSSYADSWLRHAKSYVDMAAERFALTSASRVVEVASNDGYLLQYFVARGVPLRIVAPTGPDRPGRSPVASVM